MNVELNQGRFVVPLSEGSEVVGEDANALSSTEFARIFTVSADLSFSKSCEVSFGVFVDPTNNGLIYTEPIIGTERTVSCPTSYARRLGIYPRSGYTLISCHFHPPDTVLIHSASDLANLERCNSAQNVSIVDILAMARPNGDIDLIMLRQMQRGILRAVYNDFEDPNEFFYPHTIFERFRRNIVERTFSRVLPDQPDFRKELAAYADGCLKEDFVKLSKLLPPDYPSVFVEELELTGFYEALYKAKGIIDRKNE